jgi:hypothetical protein
MESICDAPFPAVSRENKIEHLSLGTPFEIAKAQKKMPGQSKPIFNPASKRIYATFPEYQERTENTMQFVY